MLKWLAIEMVLESVEVFFFKDLMSGVVYT